MSDSLDFGQFQTRVESRGEVGEGFTVAWIFENNLHFILHLIFRSVVHVLKKKKKLDQLRSQLDRWMRLKVVGLVYYCLSSRTEEGNFKQLGSYCPTHKYLE